MTVTTRSLAGFVFAISAGVLGAVLASQYWGGLAPCELCLAERWPWEAALAVSALGFALFRRIGLPPLAILLAAILAAGAALAFYHVGVELHWFAGPSACTASGTDATSIEELRRQILGHQPVQCDQVQWSLFGVSLAGWNLIASLATAGICLGALRRAGGAKPTARLGRAAR
jgi:disulfide bond formation protein DsbB